jgi:CRISPR-associated protein Cas2
VLAYDVPEDGVRARIASTLEGYGWRVQKSVFECHLEPRSLERLALELERELVASAAGNVRIYRLCAECAEAAYGFGKLAHGAGSRKWIVL